MIIYLVDKEVYDGWAHWLLASICIQRGVDIEVVYTYIDTNNNISHSPLYSPFQTLNTRRI